ncbi:MAG TPA: SlyX family protein [Alphaproteobacteria bacterium]|nr:SlyX family protein [Alphaproteobacteria bacterium]USO05260.1 MAG: SlyX family protein [Rhodospirillales bacterium]HOO82177.1 SlyX family protein [Alphaproteobacteria bacterium]
MNNTALNKVEETLAHQEQQINDLSDMVITQGRDIEALKKQIRKLQDKISSSAEDNNNEKPLSATEYAARNKPPHY